MAAPVARDTHASFATNTNPFVLGPLSTTQTDYILLLAFYNEHTGTAAATVTSVTSAGVTWARRRRSNSSTTGCLEVWWAHGTGTLSVYSININVSGAYDNGAATVTVVTGCANPAAPFDANVGLPAALSGPTGTWTPSFTGINTSSTDDLLLFVVGSVSGGGTPPAGFTQLIRSSTGAGSWAAAQDTNGQGVTALQSSATFTYGSALTNGFGAQTSGEAIFDALAGNLPAGGGAQARALVLA